MTVFCDVVNLGVSLIFHGELSDGLCDMDLKERKISSVSVRLSALSISGKVILPVMKNDSERLKLSS